jgi:hypothetical protein
VTAPTVAARVVAQLGLHQTGDDGDDAVDVTLLRDACPVDQLDGAAEHFFGECVRLQGGDEAWEVALEEQFVSCWVLEAESDERTHPFLQRGAGVTRVGELIEPVEQLLVAVGEHRVVQRVLRVEVFVQRRLAHPHLAGQGVQRNPGDPMLARESPGAGDDRGDFGLSTLRHLVSHQATSAPDRGGEAAIHRPSQSRRQPTALGSPVCRGGDPVALLEALTVPLDDQQVEPAVVVHEPTPW